MAKYACSDEGVAALKDCAARILDGAEGLKAETSAMRSVGDEYSDTLGPHLSELNSALDGIQGALARCIEPANNIADLLNEVAEGYQDVIDTNPFGTGGN